ncbi:unnamed protein product [Lathyrus sativus]|nr:unnamed protein product [Lathyrus sativus]
MISIGELGLAQPGIQTTNCRGNDINRRNKLRSLCSKTFLEITAPIGKYSISYSTTLYWGKPIIASKASKDSALLGICQPDCGKRNHPAYWGRVQLCGEFQFSRRLQSGLPEAAYLRVVFYENCTLTHKSSLISFCFNAICK